MMYAKTLISALTLAISGRATAFSGQVFCDQGDAGITAAFAAQIIASVDQSSTFSSMDLSSTFGVPGLGFEYNFTPDCLSTSQTDTIGGLRSCCQVAFQQTGGQTGTVTMTANTLSTGADSVGGVDTGATLSSIANLILSTCWTDPNSPSLHSGRWAGQGDIMIGTPSNYQVGLSGGTC